MKPNMMLSLLLLNCRLLSFVEAQDFYEEPSEPTAYPLVLDDLLFEDDTEYEEHVRVVRVDTYYASTPAALQDGSSAEGGDQAVVPAEDLEYPATLASGPTVSGVVDEDLVPQVEESVRDELMLHSSMTSSTECLMKIVDILKEIRTELLEELKVNRRTPCKHRNEMYQSSLNCLCGFFDSAYEPMVQLLYRNISGESKGDYEENACIESCISMVLKHRSYVRELICYEHETGLLNQSTVHLYTSPDGDDLEWKYSGYASPDPVCCHRREKVDCARIEEHDLVVVG